MADFSYSHAKQKLEELIDELNSSDIDIDEAIKFHKKATKLLKQLEDYLKEAEQKIDQS